MTHKSTLLTYLIMTLLRKHSLKNDQIFTLCILTENDYSVQYNHSFNFFQLNFVPISRNITLGLHKISRNVFLT